MQTTLGVMAASTFLALAACGGGSSTATAGLTPPSKIGASVKIVIPRSASSAQYISSSTQSIGVHAYDATHATLITSIAQNLTSTAPGCTAASGTSPLTCTIALPLAAGSYALDLTLYDGTVANGAPSGNKLSAATNVPLTVTAGQANALSVAFGGVPASVAIVPSATSSLTGSTSSGFTFSPCSPQTVNVYALDADGNDIVGTGAPSVALTTSDLNYTISAAGSSAPNTFTIDCLAVNGIAATFAAKATPVSSSGASAVNTNISLTATNAISGTVTQTTIPNPIGTPEAIAPGSDGALWIVGASTQNIARVTTSGSVSTFFSPLIFQAQDIAPGPDGALWFTDLADNSIGRITTNGVTTEYPTLTANSQPFGISAGPDGALWFTEVNVSKIGRITTTGTVTEFTVPSSLAYVENIAAGPDGALWFTEGAANKIGRITTNGAISEYSIPTANALPFGIAAGSDGNLWFTEQGTAKVGRITTSGAITEYPVSASPVQPSAIAAGPDGALYFTETTGQAIGRITTSGAITKIVIPTSCTPTGITAGSDGRLWYVCGPPVAYGTVR